MSDSPPLFSIITINLNNAEGLSKTIYSVINQSCKKFEYIVIDGGSTDESRNIIIENSNKIAFWVSEKDTGIYNAMNKGTKMAKGQYLFYLNSGDLFKDNQVLKDIEDSIKGEYDLIAGDVLIDNGQSRKIWKTKEEYRFSEVAFGHLPHQGFFFRRELFSNFGLYDESLRIVADWAYLMKLILANVSILYTGHTFAVHLLDGISQNPNLFTLQEKERNDVLSKYTSLNEDLNEIRLNARLSSLLVNKIKKSISHRLRRYGILKRH